jgi:Uma2 family endonuclease
MAAMLADLPREMTLEEWADMDEDDEGELVDGVLVEEEMPGYAHEVVVGWLCRRVGTWLEAQGDGFIGGSDAKFAVRPRRGRKPDVTVYLPGGKRPPAYGLIRVPPDIAVEIITPTPRDERRDRVEKVADYAAFGVRWYWLINPEARTFEILELGADGRYIHAATSSDEPIAPVPGCPGLTLDIRTLWSELDRLPPEHTDPD